MSTVSYRQVEKRLASNDDVLVYLLMRARLTPAFRRRGCSCGYPRIKVFLDMFGKPGIGCHSPMRLESTIDTYRTFLGYAYNTSVARLHMYVINTKTKQSLELVSNNFGEITAERIWSALDELANTN